MQVVHTFRVPDVLLVYQLALIVGTFFVGFLNAPLLYLSRYLAQRPTHRLRWPQKRDLHRKLLSGFFFVFAAAFVVGVLGPWVRLLLNGSNPWTWALRFILLGRHQWTRPALIAYWVLLVTVSVTAWQQIIVAPRRYSKHRTSLHAMPAQMPSGLVVKEVPDNDHRCKLAGQNTRKEGAASTMKKAAHLSLNARRKFFHGLAVLMFIPGVLFEVSAEGVQERWHGRLTDNLFQPDFTHLALSLAFALFTFAEYIRYFALYPLGAPLHIFLNEFLDQKDSGPVILSHFYLLSGCALPLWLGATTALSRCSGILVLGIGDALASVVGRKYGRMHWPGSSKTLEGTLAFAASIYFTGLALQASDAAANMQPFGWLIAVILIAILEGASEQNDNLILPIFSYVVCTLL